MAIKKYHVSKNLFDKSTATLGYYVNSSTGELTQSGNFFASDYIPIEQGKTYYWNDSTTRSNAGCFYDSNKNRVSGWSNQVSNVQYFTTPTNVAYVRLTGARANIDNMQLNTGSTALPYEPYGDSFKDWFYREYGTDTDTITSLPKTIIGDGQPISAYTVKGNMVQSGTPTPSNPVYPVETGDKTANLYDYKTAYSAYVQPNGDVTATAAQIYAVQNVFGRDLIGTEVTMSVKVKTVGSTYVSIRAFINGNRVDGNTIARGNTGTLKITVTPETANDYWFITYGSGGTDTYSDFMLNTGSTVLTYEPFGYKIPISLSQNTYNIYITEPLRKSLDGSNVYDTIESNGTLTRRVDANGDALATPTTELVTVPTLTTTGTAEQFNVLTTLAPSEVSLTYHGWHEHSDTKYTSG